MLHHACGQQGAIDAERGRVNDDETLGHSGQKTLLTDIEYDLCPATQEDIPAIGKLCEMFAAESVRCSSIILFIHAY